MLVLMPHYCRVIYCLSEMNHLKIVNIKGGGGNSQFDFFQNGSSQMQTERMTLCQSQNTFSHLIFIFSITYK